MASQRQSEEHVGMCEINGCSQLADCFMMPWALVYHRRPCRFQTLFVHLDVYREIQLVQSLTSTNIQSHKFYPLCWSEKDKSLPLLCSIFCCRSFYSAPDQTVTKSSNASKEWLHKRCRLCLVKQLFTLRCPHTVGIKGSTAYYAELYKRKTDIDQYTAR